MRCVPGCADAAADKGTPPTLAYWCACARLSQHELRFRMQTLAHTATSQTYEKYLTEVLAVPGSVQAQRKLSRAVADAHEAVQQT